MSLAHVSEPLGLFLLVGALPRKRQLSSMEVEAEKLKRRRREMKIEEHEVRTRMWMLRKGVPLSPPRKAQHSLQLSKAAGGGEGSISPSRGLF